MTTALVLPVEAAGSSEPQTVAGMPGLWRPGVAYLPEALGVTEDEAKALIEEASAPIELVDVQEAEPSFTVEGVQVPTSQARVEAENAREAVGADPAGEVPGWVEQARARATALSNGERVPSPHETNELTRIESLTKAQLVSEAEDAGIARASTMSKDTLVQRLHDHYFGGVETPPEAEQAAESDEEASGEASSEEQEG